MFKWRWVKDWFSPREVITENPWSNSLKSFLKVCRNWLWFVAFSLLWQLGVPLPRDAVFYVVIPSSWRISFPVTFLVILLLEKIWKTPHDFSYWLIILAWICATVHVNNAFLVQWLYLLIYFSFLFLFSGFPFLSHVICGLPRLSDKFSGTGCWFRC